MQMPVGRYQGLEMEDIPSSYLKWVAEKWEEGPVCEAADKEWTWREENNEHIKG